MSDIPEKILTEEEYNRLSATLCKRLGVVVDNFLTECRDQQIERVHIPGAVFNAYINLVCIYVDTIGDGDSGKRGLIRMIHQGIEEYFVRAKVMREQASSNLQ